MNTSHGHHIPGTIHVEAEVGVACGGPGACLECGKEQATAMAAISSANQLQVINEVRVKEVSVVTNPANPNAVILNNPMQSRHIPIPEMRDNPRTGVDTRKFDRRAVERYPDEAVQLVKNYLNHRLAEDDFTYRTEEVYVVWFSKTLRNWKGLVATSRPDGKYFEVTYNSEKGETYIDAYMKTDNYVVSHQTEDMKTNANS